jgi:ketopantoate reductase
MNKPVVLIGIGEMGGVFARGFLRIGHPVIPVTRSTDMQTVAEEIEDPELVLVAVAENDLQPTLQALPGQWRDKTGMLQNELLPRDWASHHLENPTVISVWFEKKKGQDAKVLIPSPAFGPHAELLKNALESIDIPCRVLNNENQLLHELILKNVYIVTTNLAGLVTGGTVSELWKNHESLAREVANEVMDIQEWLTGKTIDRDEMIHGMLVAFNGDPEHNCMGRSAPARLARALRQAEEAGIDVPRMKEIQSKQGQD